MRRTSAIALAVLSSGCFATRNDVRILQADIFASRTAAAQADSARARQIAALLTALTPTLNTLSDSVKDLSNRLLKFQGETRQEQRNILEQLLQIGELTGQSQKRLQDLRADIEANRQQQFVAPPVAPAPGDTTKRSATAPSTTSAPGQPGPNQLYLLAREQVSAQSYSTAREAFQELLRLYPNDENAPAAQLGIADTYAVEGRVAEADSTNRLVIDRYKSSAAAPTAMYRLGLSLSRQGKKGDARVMMTTLRREYPRSDEAEFAQDWLTRNPA